MRAFRNHARTGACSGQLGRFLFRSRDRTPCWLKVARPLDSVRGVFLYTAFGLLSSMPHRKVLVAGLLLASAVPAAGQRTSLSVSLGLNAPVDYHAPISPYGRIGGPSASLYLGDSPGHRWLSARGGASVHLARADASYIRMARTELSILLSRPVPAGTIAPYAAVGGAYYRGSYDVCGMPRLLGDTGASDPCSGARTGWGWQLSLGAAPRRSRGTAPFVELRYMVNRRLFDGLVATVGASF